ncbi:alcohol dehydrogenase catalytic domain-containing protein [Actinopolymorpha alba]|uniref:alcohol dehydrogenase catalytic domain-containing protein n=1 Tax=Actinopolymorpha alba TaxID=533267 RepID=UPI000360A404|nr:alcohol dehydrogenase catalytic domain-containing protein [Actinopolymorpha alba]
MPIAEAPRLIGNEQVSFVPISYPDPAPGQILLRVRANAVCGSDREIFAQGSDTIAGHEVAGEVAAVGPGATVPIGARGVAFLMAYCGRCRNCQRGATNVCLDKSGDLGFNRDGGLGPFALIDERVFFPVDDDIPFPLATMLLDVMGTSGHAMDRASLVRPDIESLYVAGAGPVGIGVLVMARIRFGPDVPIRVSDVSPWRLEFAESLGARPVHADRVDSIPLVDVAIDASGRTSAREAAVARLAKGGALICVGHGQDLRLDVSPDLIATERAVLGSEYFPFADLAHNLTLLREHRDTIARVITHTYDVAEVGEAFRTFLSGQSGKVVVTQA